MAVRRALNDKKLREESEEVRQALQHSQSLYRTGHEIIVVDITEQRTLEEELRHQASTDSLPA